MVSPPALNQGLSQSCGQSSLSNLSIIFRLCENARFTILVNVAACSRFNSGFDRRSSVTQAESTSGRGKKQSAGTLNQPCGS